MKVLVTGGTGFVGKALVPQLIASGADVRVLVHTERPVPGGAESVRGDVTDADSVLAAAKGCTHVIHLVSIIRGRPEDFERIMVEGTQNVLAAARAAGVERFVQMSALGVDEHTRTLSHYYASKWQMEQDVATSGFEHVIFRPSFIFGGGGILPTFFAQVRFSPIVAVIGSGRRTIQPIWIDDVAAHFTAAVTSPAPLNRAFDLGGPDVVSWNELYRRIARTLGKRRLFVNVPAGLARTGARLTERWPAAPLTVDQVNMLEKSDSVARENDAAETFGLPLVPLDEQLRRGI